MAISSSLVKGASHSRVTSRSNSVVSGLYSITKRLVGLFAGILSPVATPGVETTAIFEPATLIAMVVTAVVAWVVLKLITPHDGSRVESTAITERTE